MVHANFVPQDLLKSKKLDGKIWLEEVNKILGGKVGQSRLRLLSDDFNWQLVVGRW